MTMHRDIPGFIDLQVNGYKGVDFLVPETTVDDILGAARELQRQGTAGFLLTVTTNNRETIEITVRHAREAMERQGPHGPILGIHLEGPFISPEYGYRGAHMEKYICDPDVAWFAKLQDIANGAIRLVTLAPELPGALEFIRALSPGVTIAMGHANPTFSQLREAIAAGLSAVTHFGNGVRPDIPRHENVIVNALACPELTLCFIPDGQHLPEPFLRLLLTRVPVEKLVAVSDMVMYAGLQPGLYRREDTQIRLRPDGRLCLAQDERLLYGASAPLLPCLNRLAALDLLPPGDLLRVGVDNPLRLLGLDPDTWLDRPAGVRFVPERREFVLLAG